MTHRNNYFITPFLLSSFRNVQKQTIKPPYINVLAITLNGLLRYIKTSLDTKLLITIVSVNRLLETSIPSANQKAGFAYNDAPDISCSTSINTAQAATSIISSSAVSAYMFGCAKPGGSIKAITSVTGNKISRLIDKRLLHLNVVSRNNIYTTRKVSKGAQVL